VTIRTAIEQLLSGRIGFGDGAGDPAEALAEQGFHDVSGGHFGTALEHFSDTAPLLQADALAPIVTRVSAVPYESDDLAPLGAGGIDEEMPDDGDAFGLFDAVAPTVETHDDETGEVEDDGTQGTDDGDGQGDDTGDGSFGTGALPQADESPELDDVTPDDDVDAFDQIDDSGDAGLADEFELVIDDHEAFSYESTEDTDTDDGGIGDDGDGFDDIDFDGE
jgi:hypothetical protein